MLKTGILNPRVLELLARVRHTNTLVIADRGFPYWPELTTVDLALVDNVPTVLQVLAAIRPNFVIGKAWMAQEFLQANGRPAQRRFIAALRGVALQFEPHGRFKQRVPHAIGLIRSGGRDTLREHDSGIGMTSGGVGRTGARRIKSNSQSGSPLTSRARRRYAPKVFHTVKRTICCGRERRLPH